MLAGNPGLGKSLVSVDITARISTGGDWPGGERGTGIPGKVLLLSAEDDLEDTIRPRLDAAGAEPRNVYAIRATRILGERLTEFELGRDLTTLGGLVKRLGTVKLLVIDPISAYLGRVDSNNNAEVRAFLRPLTAFAEQTGVAVLCINHLNKSMATEAVYRIQGSLAFVAAARQVLAIAKDPNDGSRRLMLPVKSNLAEDRTGLAYRIYADPDIGAIASIAWEPSYLNMSMADLLTGSASPATNRADSTEIWLEELLADGKPALTTAIKAAALEHGFGWTQVWRASRSLGVQRSGNRGQPLVWRLPVAPVDASGPVAIPSVARPLPAKLSTDLLDETENF